METGPALSKKILRIGIDVGGTNTDGVVIDPTRAWEPGKGILAWHKTPTTVDPSDGIRQVMVAMMKSNGVMPSKIATVNIGTTHFVNAIIQRDARRLSRVAVLRLGKPFTKHMPPCIEWPRDLKALVLGHHALLRGGLEVHGGPIGDIDADEIRAECAIIADKGIRCVVICGIFSPIDSVENQERRTADIVLGQLPDCDVVLSSEVTNLGFLERENAAILNAAILRFGRETIRSFRQPLRQLGLDCPIFITQNDGTVLQAELAAKLPTRTFSSGPTNSMLGAAFLVKTYKPKDGTEGAATIVIDIGGTTSDVGLLLPNGLPRQRAAFSELAGVRVNFSCPDVASIGLGGGSVVRADDGHMEVGPESVGHRLTEDAIAFGGHVVTATDCAILADPKLEIGNRDWVQKHPALGSEDILRFQRVIREKLERVIDATKTSPGDLPVIIVGGGAVLAPDQLKGASKVLRPRWAGVVNAIGAAVAQISAVVDTIKPTESKTTQEWLEELSQEVIEKTVQAGASRSTVVIVEMVTLPIPYATNAARFILRATGGLDLDNESPVYKDVDDQDPDRQEHEHGLENNETVETDRDQRRLSATSTSPKLEMINFMGAADMLAYRPKVKDRVWHLSEIDIGWIATGCYILGAGGGGSPYATAVRLRQMVHNGDTICVVHPRDIPDDARVGGACFVGSPSVLIEKLAADELLEAQQELARVLDRPITHLNCLEIGGANGMQSLVVSASSNLDLPTVDGDFCGRAYPVLWQTTPYVANERQPVYIPVALSDGNGNSVTITRSGSDKIVERLMRAVLSELGSAVGAAFAPSTGAETKRWIIENTMSLAWRIGRAVHCARRSNRTGMVAESIIDSCGGPEAAKVLWRGKIVAVERILRKGHLYGECIVEGNAEGGFSGRVNIPFKNENIAAIKLSSQISQPFEPIQVNAQNSCEGDILGIVPDLVCVLDAQDGEAIGTQDYRYGLNVIVLGIAASEQWTNSKRGINIGGPEGFDVGHLKYKPLGRHINPQSVIDEFDQLPLDRTN